MIKESINWIYIHYYSCTYRIVYRIVTLVSGYVSNREKMYRCSPTVRVSHFGPHCQHLLARIDTCEPEVANANGRALCEFWLASGDWLAQASRLVRLALASCDWLQHRASGFSIVPMAKRIQASDAGTPERSRQVDHFRRAACRLNVNVRLLAWVILKIWPPLRACKEIVFLFYLSHLSKLW